MESSTNSVSKNFTQSAEIIFFVQLGTKIQLMIHYYPVINYRAKGFSWQIQAAKNAPIKNRSSREQTISLQNDYIFMIKRLRNIQTNQF